VRRFTSAFRNLFKTPVVTMAAITSLALGIGATAGIFSVFHHVLLQPLAVPHPSELVNLSAPGPKPGSQSCVEAGSCEAVFSYPMFRDLRTREFGLRMALGAAPGRLRRMVLGQVAVMTLVGGLIGLAGATGVGKGAQSILFHMTGADPVVLALSAAAMALVALCAGLIPAHRASRVDPMRALRYE
jgi:hypothetical protein